MTGIWPRSPRRYWHVGPMARSVRDLALAYSLLAGPDGADGLATSPLAFDAGTGASPDRPLRVGWLVEPGFGPIDREVAASVQAAADALRDAGCEVAPVRIPALEQDNALEAFLRLHVMEMKPDVAAATAGHEADMFAMSKFLLGTARHLDGRLPAGGAGIGPAARRFCPLLPGSRRAAFVRCCRSRRTRTACRKSSSVVSPGSPRLQIMAATVPFNVTGLPALSIRYGTSREGLPIGVQLVTRWMAESTVLHLAALLEATSPFRDLHPVL